MKAISVRQPWASYIAKGKKTIETRSWPTNYRGDLLIVSSKSDVASSTEPLGKALCIAKLVDCRLMTENDEEATMVKFLPGMFAWVLKDIRPIEPFSVQGKQSLYEVDYNDLKVSRSDK